MEQTREPVGPKAQVTKVVAVGLGGGRDFVWTVMEAVPEMPEVLVVQMLLTGDAVEIFTIPVKGSQLEKDMVAGTNGRGGGYRYIVPMQHVKLVETFVPLDVWEELRQEAMAVMAENEMPGDDEDEEDETEDEEDEVPTPPAVAAVVTGPKPYVPPAPLPSAAPNGQTGVPTS